MPAPLLHRRRFLSTTAALAASPAVSLAAPPKGPAEYRGPNVVLIRFGGGARRRESISDASKSYSPYLLKELAPRGVLFNNLLIGDVAETGHGQGTLNLLTGKYDNYTDAKGEFLGERFEAKVPTLFEYLRREYNVAEHQTLVVNGEDRTQEEFYTFSNHHLFGAEFRSNVLSLYRYKVYLLEQQIAANELGWSEQTLEAKRRELQQMRSLDYRTQQSAQSPEIDRFWQRWRTYYGDSGLVNPRGDRLLTELAVRALQQLRPRLMMVNYNDCDYVHWGNMAHYTQGIAIMDAGIQRLVNAVESDAFYRGNTIFVVAPDCGRDTSPFAAVPCQHHFNSRSSREVFALFVGPGIDRGRVVDRKCEQIEVARTIGQAMGLAMPHAEAAVLEEAFV